VSRLASPSYAVAFVEISSTDEQCFAMYEVIAKLELEVDRHLYLLAAAKYSQEPHEVVANGPGDTRHSDFVAG
jgi:hypothetical protein